MQSLSGRGHVAQEFRCGLQIPVGIGDVSVTKIGAQRSHVPRNSLTVSRTLFERPDRKCMAQILDAAAAELPGHRADRRSAPDIGRLRSLSDKEARRPAGI